MEVQRNILRFYIYTCVLCSLDEDILAAIKPYNDKYEAILDDILITTTFELSSMGCTDEECIIGDLLADIFLKYHQDKWKKDNSTKKALKPSIALMQAGGIRTGLPNGSEQ